MTFVRIIKGLLRSKGFAFLLLSKNLVRGGVQAGPEFPRCSLCFDAEIVLAILRIVFLYCGQGRRDIALFYLPSASFTPLIVFPQELV